jgi:Zn-dependent peptidase ImmA (M78 family)
MNQARSEEIAGLADAVADMLCWNAPITPQDIAGALDVTFSVGRYGDCFDALLEWKGERFHIYLNKDRGNEVDSPRGRFSFAHELGHYCIDEHRWALMRGVDPHGSFTDFFSDNDAEREADTFAANLLLPGERVRKRIGKRVINANLIVETAKHFGASLSATAIRCARLGLSPLIVMAWQGNRRRWCWSSQNFEAITHNLSHLTLDRIPPDSLTREISEQAATLPEGRIEAKGTTLSTWFPRIRPTSTDNLIMVEEVIGIGRFGVITVLRPDGL